MSLKLTRLSPWSVNPQHPNVDVATRRSKRSRSQAGDSCQDQGSANVVSDSPTPASQRNKSQVNKTTCSAICANATSVVTGMNLVQDPNLPTPATSHHSPMEEAMLFRLQSVQRVLAIGSFGRVYLARYTFNQCSRFYVVNSMPVQAEKCLHAHSQMLHESFVAYM